VEKIRRQTAGLRAPKVFLQVGTRPLFGAIPGSFINDFITLAGGINIIADQDKGTTKVEKVIALNPDVIIIAIMGSESGIAGDEKRRWNKFHILNAVQNNRVFIINPDLACSPSPITFANTLAVVAGMIHPEFKRSGK
jgi:iron complex transport system substrate-binding protein